VTTIDTQAISRLPHIIYKNCQFKMYIEASHEIHIPGYVLVVQIWYTDRTRKERGVSLKPVVNTKR